MEESNELSVFICVHLWLRFEFFTVSQGAVAEYVV